MAAKQTSQTYGSKTQGLKPKFQPLAVKAIAPLRISNRTEYESIEKFKRKIKIVDRSLKVEKAFQITGKAGTAVFSFNFTGCLNHL